MLKFKGSFERPIYQTVSKNGRIYTRREVDIPTVDEVYETIAPMTADTVLQILHGQGIYWGPRYNSELDQSGARLPVYNEKKHGKAGKLRIDTRSKIPTRIVSKETKEQKKCRLVYKNMKDHERQAIRIIAQCNHIPIVEAVNKFLIAENDLERKKINDYVLERR